MGQLCLGVRASLNFLLLSFLPFLDFFVRLVAFIVHIYVQRTFHSMGAWLPCVYSGFDFSTLIQDATLYHVFDRVLSLLINGTCDLAAKRVKG